MSLKISCNWLDRAPQPTESELDATFAALRVIIAGVNSTAYSEVDEGRPGRGSGRHHEKLHIPAYFLAEWFSENWWPLLNEPRKNENSDDREFQSRHSILTAQHGFALPSVLFEPLGEMVRIACRPHTSSLAGVNFGNSAETFLPRHAVEGVLRSFVETCVNRLEVCEIKDTPLQQAWADVEATAEDEATFCRLAGAIGINPYEVNDNLAAAINTIYDCLGEKAALDLCMASNQEGVLDFADTAAKIAERLGGYHDATLAPLSNLQIQQDNFSLPGWRRGVAVANSVRKLLDINIHDDQGCDKLLEKLQISTHGYTEFPSNHKNILPGAFDRVDEKAAFLLWQNHEEGRRFSASRAVFLSLYSGKKATRFVTDAQTRDQQASRAFAAEILVPKDYLKSKARHRKIGRDDIHSIAWRRRAAVEVVEYQATNNGLNIEGRI